MYVVLNGEFVESNDAKVSVFDHGFLYGDGIYDTLRTYSKKIWNFDAHFKRFEKASEILGIRIPYSKDEIKTFVEDLIRRNDFSESRIKMIVTRGCNDFDFGDPKKATFLIICTELNELADEFYENGISVITVSFKRNFSELKSLSLMPMVMARREMFEKNAREALFVDQNGYITEGSVTNAYFVKRNEIYVPEIDMLPGTTREIVLKIASEKGHEIVFKNCMKGEFYEADEVFLTNAIKGVVPVVSMDGFEIGAGKIGPVTQKLMFALSDKIKSEIDE